MVRTVSRADPNARRCYGAFYRFLHVPKGYEDVSLEETPFVARNLNIDQPGTLADAIEMAMFAVDHYNRTQDEDLVFKKLFKSTCHSFDGDVLHLTFSARSRSATHNASKFYEVKGWQRPCMKTEVILFQERSEEGFGTVPVIPEAATEMAKFAIESYNHAEDENLVFENLIEGTTSQAVSSSVFYVYFSARGGPQNESKNYKAELWQRTTTKKEVILFKEISEEGIEHQMSHMSISSDSASDSSEYSDESDTEMDPCSEDDPSEKSDESDQEM